MKNQTRIYLNKVYAAQKAFCPRKRFHRGNLNVSWAKAPDDYKAVIMKWLLQPMSAWEPVKVDRKHVQGPD